ncbi:MAG: CAP domain-containing protein [Steroidobacteraceae bacterium]|nr:CAP domain-containing protein [Steroidobacteraceae bacterium]
MRYAMKAVCCIPLLLAVLAMGPAIDRSRVAQAGIVDGDAGQRILQLVNEARSQPRRCGWKRHGAAPPLVFSATLQSVALAHARDMASRGELDHAGHDGSTPALRVTRAGYRWRFTGENIASGQPTAETVVAGWLKSPRHCANIMDPDFTELGAGHAVEPRAAGRIFWVQVFASPQP